MADRSSLIDTIELAIAAHFDYPNAPNGIWAGLATEVESAVNAWLAGEER